MRCPETRRVPSPLAMLSLVLLLSPAASAKGAAPVPGGRSRSASDPWLPLLLRPGKEHARNRSPPPRPPTLGADVEAWPMRPLQRPGVPRSRQANLGERFKRHNPPLSIDLTFHLLRQMLEISRAQSQQAQAKQNRLLLDSVGK